jgi:hypothetical protein
MPNRSSQFCSATKQERSKGIGTALQVWWKSFCNDGQFQLGHLGGLLERRTASHVEQTLTQTKYFELQLLQSRDLHSRGVQPIHGIEHQPLLVYERMHGLGTE